MITKMPRLISKNASSHVSGVLTNANKDMISKKNLFLEVIWIKVVQKQNSTAQIARSLSREES